jgi:wyosine [tRNA(Phe)-imidazoG37] synthetase (radical SAM superfamily)
MEKGVEVFPLKTGITYGPVNSRRLGRSLGINLSPVKRKLCSFNCIYCHYGWTERLTMDVLPHKDEFPSVKDVGVAVRSILQSIENPEYITFSGDGEPTLHPEFEDAVREVKKIRDELSPRVPLAILTNSSVLGSPSVRKAMEMIDLRICKLDAGTQDVFEQLNNPVPGIRLEGIVEQLKSMENIVIQTIFLDGAVDNTRESNLFPWIRLIGNIKPRSVQVYSSDRPVPQMGIERVSPERLAEIAQRTQRETGVRVDVYSFETKK